MGGAQLQGKEAGRLPGEEPRCAQLRAQGVVSAGLCLQALARRCAVFRQGAEGSPELGFATRTMPIWEEIKCSKTLGFQRQEGVISQGGPACGSASEASLEGSGCRRPARGVG